MRDDVLTWLSNCWRFGQTGEQVPRLNGRKCPRDFSENGRPDPCCPLGLDYRQIVAEYVLIGRSDSCFAKAQRGASSGQAGGWARGRHLLSSASRASRRRAIGTGGEVRPNFHELAEVFCEVTRDRSDLTKLFRIDQRPESNRLVDASAIMRRDDETCKKLGSPWSIRIE